MRVLVNGFGRIGRTLVRAWLRDPGVWPGVEIVAVNDIAPPATCAYLFEYDSVFGPFPGGVELEAGALVLAGRRLRLSHAADISEPDLGDIDLVLECTGRAEARAVAERGLRAGAGRELISGPSAAADVTVVLGANEGLAAGRRIVSNASCTTNALAPLARVLDREFGLVTGWMTTIHCYTGSQPTVDAPHGEDLARARAAALSMVPTTTSAGRLLGEVLPELAGRLTCAAVRVPTASVSAVDMTFLPGRMVGAAEVNAALRAAGTGEGAVIGWTERPLVSSDLRARSESVIMALSETAVTGGGLVRVFGWYDNEWGFSCRMLDMAALMAAGRV